MRSAYSLSTASPTPTPGRRKAPENRDFCVFIHLLTPHLERCLPFSPNKQVLHKRYRNGEKMLTAGVSAHCR